MLTYDAFAFPQVTFLLFILAGIGAATLSERSVSLTVVSRRQADARTVPLLTSGPG
jgi:hypothetical protein